jgi:hypothetical protein
VSEKRAYLYSNLSFRHFSPFQTYASLLDFFMQKGLLDQGAIVDTQDVHGWTALRYASDNDHARVAHLLLDHGANMFSADALGETPLNKSSNCMRHVYDLIYYQNQQEQRNKIAVTALSGVVLILFLWKVFRRKGGVRREATATEDDSDSDMVQDVEQTGLYAFRKWVVLVVSGIYHRLSYIIWRVAFFLVIPDPDRNIAAERDVLRNKVLAAVQNKDSSLSDDGSNNNNNDTNSRPQDTTPTMRRDKQQDEVLHRVIAERDALRYKVDEYRIREEEYKLREVEYKLREERLREQIAELHELNIKQLIE